MLSAVTEEEYFLNEQLRELLAVVVVLYYEGYLLLWFGLVVDVLCNKVS